MRYFFFPILLILLTGVSSPLLAQPDTTEGPFPSTADLDTQIQQLEDEINREYFSNARAKNYAIACARYAEEAYFYAKDIHQGYNLNRTYLQKARANADTSYWFVKRALMLADSAIDVASDTSHLAVDYMYRAIGHLQTAKKNLEDLYATADQRFTQFHGQRAMFENSHGLIDAYHASLLFGDGERKPDEEPEDALASAVTRTEADEATFSTLTFMYEERIKRLEEEIEALRKLLEETLADTERAKLEEKLAALESEKAILESKLANASETLEQIRNDLAIQDKLAAQAAAAGNPDDPNGSNPNGAGGDPNGGNPPKDGPLDPDELPMDGPDYPMGMNLPAGTVYRVQIGYYPLSSRPNFQIEEVDGARSSSYIRYYTGIFRTYAEATEAKNKIRETQVSDAFLVAFRDGVKISVYDALQEEQAGSGTE